MRFIRAFIVTCLLLLLGPACGSSNSSANSAEAVISKPPLTTSALPPPPTPVITPPPTPAITAPPTPVITTPPTSGQPDQARAQNDKASPFTSGSPEVKACLRTALGNELFTAIAAGAHTPTDDDNQKMGHCLGDDKKAQAPAAGPPEPGPVATTMDRFLGETSQPSVPARRYAAEIVSIGETRYIQMQPLLADVSYVASLQAWGANTWRVIVHYETDSDGNILWSRLPQLETAIVTARTNGLAVLLSATNFRDEFSGGTTAENRANLYAQRQAAALDLARFAERLNIEYFSPINEAEGILDNEAYGDGYGSAPVQDRVGIAVNPRGEPSLTSRVGEISTLFESMAPHLRSVYSGRLVAHFGTSHPDYRVPSYDYIGITLDHHKLDPGTFRTVVGANLDHVAAAARASGTKWMVEETYFFWSEVADPEQTGNRPHERKAGEIGEWEDADEVAQLRDLQDDYFRISLEEYAARAGGSGYDAGGWLMPGIEISGSPAETVLQEFFAGR